MGLRLYEGVLGEIMTPLGAITAHTGNIDMYAKR